MPRCAACLHYTPPRDGTSGLCRHPLSKRGTFVLLQDKPVRPEYGCIHHAPRALAQASLDLGAA